MVSLSLFTRAHNELTSLPLRVLLTSGGTNTRAHIAYNNAAWTPNNAATLFKLSPDFFGVPVLMFKNVVDRTQCPFARKATWQELANDASKPLSEQAIDAAERLRQAIPAAEREGRDMLALKIDSPEHTRDLAAFTSYVATLLSHLSLDPRSMGSDSVMLRYGWRYWVSDVQCFVLSFAPFYSPEHPRHSPTKSAYLAFQFESSFARNGVSSMTPGQVHKLSMTVKERFEEHGFTYLSEITHEAPEALHVIKPLRSGDLPIHWWKYVQADD